MKRIFSLIIIVCWVFAACQPTPGNTIVENKNDSDLKEAILKTVEPANENKNEEYEEIVHISKVAINDSGTVTVNIDADVVQLNERNISVAKLVKYNYTQEEIDKIIEAFFGENLTYYNPLISTKEDIEETILRLQLLLSDDEALLNSSAAEATGSTDLNELRKIVEGFIKEQLELLKIAPDDRPIIARPNIDDGGRAEVDNGSDDRGYVRLSGNSARFANIVCYKFSDDTRVPRKISAQTVAETDSESEEIVIAKQVAQNFIDKTKLKKVMLGDVFISLDNPHGDPAEYGFIDKVVFSERKFYVVCFERKIGENTIDYSLYEGDEDSSGYSIPWPYERMEVWVEGNEIVQFRWSAPSQVNEIMNENVALQIDYEQAIDLSVNHLFVKYSYLFDENVVEKINAEIAKVRLEMVRVKEADTNEYIIIPAWKIYGNVLQVLTEEEKNRINTTKMMDTDEYLNADDFTVLSYYPNTVTVNALDGTIINMKSGY